MPDHRTSKARLRTKTGCSTCRLRKKKCDEVKPVCDRCSAASIDCTWPSAEELAHDGRHKHLIHDMSSIKQDSQSPQSSGSSIAKFSPHAADSLFVPNAMELTTEDFEHQGFMDLMMNWAPAMDIAVSELGEDAWLFEYWCERWLPSTLHKQAHPRYLGFTSYMRSMALDHLPLMETALACAAISQFYKPSDDPGWMAKMRDKALVHHTAAVGALRDEMIAGRVDGTEDWMLATINGLTLFDNRDPKADPASSGTHVMASMQLFKAREAAKRDRRVSGVNVDVDMRRLVFERIHYEFLIYYSTIFMLYDPSFDTIIGNSIWTVIDTYFIDTPLPSDGRPENWPALGMPYKLFRLIIAISRLGRRCPLSVEDLSVASAVWEELLHWSDLIDMTKDATVGTLYILTAKILLTEIIAQHTNDPTLRGTNGTDTHNCLLLLDQIEIDSHFSRSLCWPISVLYNSMTESKDKILVKEKMRIVLENADGGGAQTVSQERVDKFLEVPGLLAMSRS